MKPLPVRRANVFWRSGSKAMSRLYEICRAQTLAICRLARDPRTGDMRVYYNGRARGWLEAAAALRKEMAKEPAK